MNSSQFASRYGEALAQHLRERTERSLHVAYELGRKAVTVEVTLLEVAAAHHAVLRDALAAGPKDDLSDLVTHSGEFLIETLAAYEMVQRGLPESQNAAEAERRRVDLLRHLSGLLANDVSPVADENALRELLQLVAEHAVEIVDAELCSVELDVPRIAVTSLAVEASPADVGVHEIGRNDRSTSLQTPLLALDGAKIGSIEVSSMRPFDETANGLLRHLAQMASASVERALARR